MFEFVSYEVNIPGGATTYPSTRVDAKVIAERTENFMMNKCRRSKAKARKLEWTWISM